MVVEGVPPTDPGFSLIQSDQKRRDHSLCYHIAVSQHCFEFSLSKETELISLFSFLTMSIIAPYCVSEEEVGEPGDSG